MKRLIETNEPSGLEALLGETVQIFCMRYIYRGTLVSVSDESIELGTDSGIVYETGVLTGPSKDFQEMPGLQVRLSSIEMFTIYAPKD